MKRPLVSIVVPVYNSEKFLEKCINSLIHQTYSNIQVILVNDGSKDNSGNICDKYAQLDKRILVVHKKNEGVSTARNIGVEKSIGEYIMFVDSDDWLEMNTILNLINVQKKKSFDIIMFGYYQDDFIKNTKKEFVFQEKEFWGKNEIRDTLPNLIKEETINSLWNKIYSSNIIKKYNIRFDDSICIGEDALFNYIVFSKIKSFKIINSCFYHYINYNPQSLTKRYNPLKYKMLIQANDFLLNKLYNDDEQYYNIKAAAYYIRLKNIYSCLLDLFTTNNQLSREEKKVYISNIINCESKINWYNYNNTKYKILLFILSTNNIHFIYYSISIISKTKNIFE